MDLISLPVHPNPFYLNIEYYPLPIVVFELKSKVFQGEKFSGSNSLLIQDIFNAQQTDLICSIFNPP
jgi:hypothetical protein